MYKVVIIKSSKNSFQRRYFCLLRKTINEGVGKQDDNFENKEQNYPCACALIVSTLHIMAKQPRKQPRTMVWPADSTVDFPKRC